MEAAGEAIGLAAPVELSSMAGVWTSSWDGRAQGHKAEPARLLATPALPLPSSNHSRISNTNTHTHTHTQTHTRTPTPTHPHNRTHTHTTAHTHTHTHTRTHTTTRACTRPHLPQVLVVLLVPKALLLRKAPQPSQPQALQRVPPHAHPTMARLYPCRMGGLLWGGDCHGCHGRGARDA